MNDTPSAGDGLPFDADLHEFVERLDAAEQAHLDWTRRVLRCAVLRESPGEDVLADDAHCRCRFGRWFTQYRASFNVLDAAGAQGLDDAHRRMHDAVRGLCRRILAGEAGGAAELATFEQTQAAVVAGLARFKTTLLARSARLDALTGLPLRHGLDEAFQRLRAQAGRHGEVLALLMIDVDHFKRVNDEHGHAVGDRALRHLAATLRAHLRSGDLLLRYGGEEFLALVQVDGAPAAAASAQRLLEALRAAPMALDGGAALALRASIGLAVAGADEPLADATARADRALYAAKAGGRDGWRAAAA